MQLTTNEKNDMALEHRKLIYYTAQMFKNSGIDKEELESICEFGFSKALDKYDKSKGIKFTTYAVSCMKNEVLCQIRKDKSHKNDISLNTTLSQDKNGNELQLEEIIHGFNTDCKSLEDHIVGEDNRAILEKILCELSDNERYIIVNRYGFDRGIIKTQKQIADDINMSQANISKIQKNALAKIRNILREREIEM